MLGMPDVAQVVTQSPAEVVRLTRFSGAERHLLRFHRADHIAASDLERMVAGCPDLPQRRYSASLLLRPAHRQSGDET